MKTNPFAPPYEQLPEVLAIFPLTGVLLLPSGQLPLNIFEPRYLKMVEDAMGSSRMIGMVQSRERGAEKPAVYSVGCAGKITDFSETEDGRYLITLTGISRFSTLEELSVNTPYRQIRPDWATYKNDVENVGCLGLDREKLVSLLQAYFTAQDISCDWGKIEDASDGRLITCLSMICPFEPKEKQALLEAPCCKTRAQIFMTMLEMAVHENVGCNRDAKH